jgi:6-phosphogluconolactonase
MNIVVSKNPAELASRAAAEFVSIAKDAIVERGSFVVALSGGSTPLILYKHLVEASLDWGRVVFFFGDERNVPPDEDASNFKGANKSLFRPLRIREDSIFRWRTELETPQAVAEDYEQTLKKFSHGIPRFDLVLLGMGADGHTASLFPGTDALNETERLAVANWVPQLGSWRFTLSYPVINNARNVMFLVAGEDKASSVNDVFEMDVDLPAKLVQPVNGKLTWFLDEASAGDLTDVNI